MSYALFACEIYTNKSVIIAVADCLSHFKVLTFGYVDVAVAAVPLDDGGYKIT